MVRSIIAVAVAASALSLAAHAAPRAVHPGECEYFWDIALTARGMATERVPLESMRRITWRIFNAQGEARVIEIGNAIVDAASATPFKEGESAADFAGELKQACLVHGGDMDRLLGVKL